MSYTLHYYPFSFCDANVRQYDSLQNEITFFGGKIINMRRAFYKFIFSRPDNCTNLLQNQLLMNYHHSLYGKTVATCTLGF